MIKILERLIRSKDGDYVWAVENIERKIISSWAEEETGRGNMRCPVSFVVDDTDNGKVLVEMRSDEAF
jgi:hypothetical protein